MSRVLTTIAILLLPLAAHAEDRVCLGEVSYRLVGEDAPAPEKARMVEEQVLAGAAQAGYQVSRGACATGEAPTLSVAVAESGALYDIAVAVGELAAAEEQFTGPFAGMLVQTRTMVETALARASVPPEPEPEPEPEEPEPEPEGPAGPAEPEPEGGSSTESASTEASAGPANSNAEELNPLWASSLALTVAGGAAMIAGVVLLVVDDPCIDEDEAHGCKERFDSSAAGIPLAGLGGIAVGVGIAGLVLLDRRLGESEDESGEAPKPTAALVPVPGGAAAGLSLAF